MPKTPKPNFFSLPAEVRLLIYERFCDAIEQDQAAAHEGPCNHLQACRRRSHADTMHVVEFQYQQSPYLNPTQSSRPDSNTAYDRFVDMKLVSRQMRAEFTPVWLRRWVFQLPRPTDPWGQDVYPEQDDPDDFRQFKHFFTEICAMGSEHVRRLRLTRHLRAQAEPEKAVEIETTGKLRRMLEECGNGGDYHERLVVNVQVRCCDVCPSSKRASKDVLFGRSGGVWQCLCDGPTTVSFERGWA